MRRVQRRMRQGIVKSLTRQLLEAFAKAEATGEHQWIPMDTRKVAVELSAANEAAFQTVDVQAASRMWLRKVDYRREGVWVEVLESYRVSKGLPPY